MTLISSVSIARKNTRSLRVTIPQGIVCYLKLKDGDRVSWDFLIDNKKRSCSIEKTSQRNFSNVKRES